MKVKVSYFLRYIDIILLITCLFTKAYVPLVIILFIVCITRLLLKIGNGSFFLELLYIYTTFVCLFMPLLGYTYFTQTNSLAFAWKKFMPIPEDTYFSFTLPAVLVIGIVFFGFRKYSFDDAGIIDRIVKRIKTDVVKIPPSTILTLLFSSLIAYIISDSLPESFQQVNNFLYNSLFASLFYIYFYKGFPMKKYIMGAIILFIVWDALRFSMFTVLAYMSGLFLILLLAGKRIRMSTKLLLFVLALVFVSFLQLFKLDLRKKVRTKADTSVAVVASSVFSNVQSLSIDNLVFPLYYRMNQGFNIALVIRRIPSQVDYLGGNNLLINFASAFVPRLIWPDKPEAGGIKNMKIYTGITIWSFSTNVGPIGEAYGSFGHLGGWAYLILFALFIRWVYFKFIKFCIKIPLLFLWMPMLFYQTIYVMEADSLQAFNSLLKGAFFLFVLSKIFPTLFSLNKKGVIKKSVPQQLSSASTTIK